MQKNQKTPNYGKLVYRHPYRLLSSRSSIDTQLRERRKPSQTTAKLYRLHTKMNKLLDWVTKPTPYAVKRKITIAIAVIETLIQLYKQYGG